MTTRAVTTYVVLDAKGRKVSRWGTLRQAAREALDEYFAAGGDKPVVVRAVTESEDGRPEMHQDHEIQIVKAPVKEGGKASKRRFSFEGDPIDIGPLIARGELEPDEIDEIYALEAGEEIWFGGGAGSAFGVGALRREA